MSQIPPVLKQIWISTGVILNQLGIGLMVCYPYCLLPALKAPESTIKVTIETGSWIASSGSIAMMLGILLSSYLMQRFGRKMAHILLMIPSILGWILIYFASNVTTIMIGRVIGGVGQGSGLILGCTVIGEYTSPENRGMLIGCKTAAMCLGNLTMHIMTYYFDWRTVAAISMVPLIIVLCNILTWPESPLWLASKGRYKESESIFYWVRGRDDKSKREFEAVIRAQNERTVDETKRLTIYVKIQNFVKILKRKDIYKPLVITFFAFVILESSGRHTFPAFASDILGEIQSDVKSQSFWFTLAMDVIITISSILSCILARIIRRRMLLFVSGALSIAILGCISLYLLLVSSGKICNERSYIPLTFLVLYFVISFMGCASIPVTLFGEIYPLAYKGFGTALGGIITSVPLALFLKITPGLLETLKVHGTFAVYGLCMAVSLIYLYFVLPETLNKTLQEVEDYFNGKTNIEKKIKNEDENLETIRLKD